MKDRLLAWLDRTGTSRKEFPGYLGMVVPSFLILLLATLSTDGLSQRVVAGTDTSQLLIKTEPTSEAHLTFALCLAIVTGCCLIWHHTKDFLQGLGQKLVIVLTAIIITISSIAYMVAPFFLRR